MAILAAYPLNWNTNDSLGSNNLTGSTLTYTAGLQNSKAAFVSASSTKVISGNNAILKDVIAWSIEFIVRTTHTWASKRAIVLWNWNYEVYSTDSSGKLAAFLDASWSYVAWNTTINNDKYHHCVVNYSWASGNPGAGTITFYVDWVADGSASNSNYRSQAAYSTMKVCLWAAQNSANYFDWYLDDVLIHNAQLSAWYIKNKTAYYKWFF